jgi:hypothetical protein
LKWENNENYQLIRCCPKAVVYSIQVFRIIRTKVVLLRKLENNLMIFILKTVFSVSLKCTWIKFSTEPKNIRAVPEFFKYNSLWDTKSITSNQRWNTWVNAIYWVKSYINYICGQAIICSDFLSETSDSVFYFEKIT